MQITHERGFNFYRWSDLKDLDWHLLTPVLVLIIFSFILLKSATGGAYLPRQFFILLLSLPFVTLPLLIKIKSWQENALWIYLLNVFFLLMVLLKGSDSMGAQRWINIGWIKLQPSEIAKLAIIISLAAWFVKHPIRRYLDIVTSSLIVLVPFILIFKQPDLGTSLAYIAIYLGMSYCAGASFTHLLLSISPILSLICNAIGPAVLSLGTLYFQDKVVELNITSTLIIFLSILLLWLIIFYKPWKSPLVVLWLSFLISLNFFIGFIRPLLWNLLHPYQQKRFTIFLNPESDQYGAGYHIIQSILAIGNGGLLGFGWQNGRLTKGNYVPAQHTDFIYSTCGEEFGFIGSVCIIIIFSLLLWRILYIAKHTDDPFCSLTAVGIFSFLSFHIFVNIGMTLGIMPITGVPLPFLSYGGTALFVNLTSIFLLLSISRRTLPKRMF